MILLLFSLYHSILGKKHSTTVNTDISTEDDGNFNKKVENVIIKIVNYPNKSLFVGVNKNNLILTDNQVEITLSSVHNSLNKVLMINNKFLTIKNDKLVFSKSKQQSFKIILVNVLRSEFVIVFNNTKCLNFNNRKLFLGSCKGKTTAIFTFYLYKQSNNRKNKHSITKKTNTMSDSNSTNDNDSNTDSKDESNSEQENISEMLQTLLKNKHKKAHHKPLNLDSYLASFHTNNYSTNVKHRKSKDDRKSIESDN